MNDHCTEALNAWAEGGREPRLYSLQLLVRNLRELLPLGSGPANPMIAAPALNRDRLGVTRQ